MFDLATVRERVDDALAWFEWKDYLRTRPRDAARRLRSSELATSAAVVFPNSPLLADDHVASAAGMKSFASMRSAIVELTPIASQERPVEATLRAERSLFVFAPHDSLSDGTSGPESQLIINDGNIPAWDLWVDLVWENGHPFLLSVAPPWAVDLIDAAIVSLADECIAWASVDGSQVAPRPGWSARRQLQPGS